MNGFKRVAASAYVSLICLIIINLFAGRGGVLSYLELNRYKETVELNIAKLEQINRNLSLDSNKLINQKDEIRIQARNLGWVEENEGIFVVDGYEHASAGYTMGKILSREGGPVSRRHSSLIIAFLSGLSIYIFTGFFSSFKLRRNH